MDKNNINADEIKKKLNTNNIYKNYNIKIIEQTTSTNNTIKQYVNDNILISNSQTAGKGRFSRKWDSPSGNIYMSIKTEYYRNHNELPIIVGISIAAALSKLYKKKFLVKWPNDIMFGHKKVAGVLIESDKNSLIIGIGINSHYHPDILKATSLSKISDNMLLNRNTIIAMTLNILSDHIKDYKKLGFANFINIFEKYNYLNNIIINAINNKVPITGKVIGINKNGALILTANKNIITCDLNTTIDYPILEKVKK